MKHPNPAGLAAIALLAISGQVHAIPGVDLAMRRTDHFELLIDRDRAAKLDTLAPLAEAAWQRLAEVTGFHPKDRVRMVFHDEDDYANGWTYAPNGWVNVWLLPAPFALRGGVDWVQDVLSHELAHVFTLQSLGMDGHLLSVGLAGSLDARKFQGSVDAQWAPYDLEAWLAEGLAQIGAESCGADRWDPQRDALEHVAWKAGQLLPDGLLRDYWGDSRQGEQIYNQGYSFLRWVLRTGKDDFPSLLRNGRAYGLRPAVESSVAMPFPRAFEAWKADLAIRHGAQGWPREPGRTLLPHDKAATWTYEPSAVGDSSGNVWGISSRTNDDGGGILYRISGNSFEALKKDAVGRPRISDDGKRLLALFLRTWSDRRAIQDLWVRGTTDGDWKMVTSRLRVQDADFREDGFVAVVRHDGANRIAVLDPLGRILSELPIPWGGDLVQVASEPGGRIFGTTMGRFGFRLLAWEEGKGWSPVFSDSVQRKDPSFARGRLWYARLVGGTWATASIGENSDERIDAVSEGGLQSPWPVGDSLLVSRYQPEGFVLVKVPLGSSGSRDTMPAAVPTFPQRGALEIGPVTSRKGDPLDIGSLVGYAFQASYLARQQRSASFDPGSKVVTDGGAYFANSTMENTLEADVRVMHGAPGEKAGWDQGFLLSIGSQTWSPILSASISYSQVTLEHRGVDSSTDTFFRGDTLPFLVQTDLQLQCVQMLSSTAFLYALFDRQTLGIGATGVTQGYSEDLQRTTQILGGFGWENFEQSRFGPLSGEGLRAFGGRVWNWVPAEIGSALDAWALGGDLSLATHVHRRLLLGAEAQVQWLQPDGGGPGTGQASAQVSAGIPLPIPAFGISLTRQRGWTFVDPILRVGHEATAQPISTGTEQLASFQGIQRLGWAPSSRFDLRPLNPWKASSSAKVLQVATVELDWKVLTLSNALSLWSVGVDIPSFDSDFGSQLRWRASISL
jgi:hypothetical protein